MGIAAKKQYLLAIKERYQNASKLEKGLILDEFCAVCRYTRKHAIRLINSPLKVDIDKKPRGCKPIYNQAVVKHLVNLWHGMGQICSKRLKSGLNEWLKYYEQPISPKEKEQLFAMSPATIDRKLRPYRNQVSAISTTKRSNWWYKCRIPIHTENVIEKDPGFIVADTVAHCGSNASGSFVNTLTVTDLGSTWTDNRAVWTKSMASVKEAIADIEIFLPFGVKSFKSDSGTEFINQTLFQYFVDRDSPIQFYRTRPYRKNDNAHVEQKNFTHVRMLFGYYRIDQRTYVDKMNEIYTEIWNPLHNLFIPSFKLIRKERMGSKVKKEYDDPKTPYQRLMESDSLSKSEKDVLTKYKEKFNPFKLRLELESRIREFRNLVTTNLVA